MLSSRIGNAAGPLPVPASSTYRSVGVIAIGVVGLLVVIGTRSASTDALTMADFNLAAPGALVAVAMLLSHISGEVDLSVGGIFALLLVLLGRTGAPGDMRVLIIVVLAVAAAVISSSAVGWAGGGAVGGVLLYFVFSDASVRLGGGISRTSELDQSLVLKTLSRSIGPIPLAVIVAVCLSAATSFVLAHSDVGRRIRAYGADPERLKLLQGSTMSAPLMVGCLVGLLLAAAATLSLSRLGNSATPAAGALLLQPLAAVVIGMGGVGRTDPSPTRVFVAYLMISFLDAQLRHDGLSSLASEVTVASVALVVALLGRDRG